MGVLWVYAEVNLLGPKGAVKSLNLGWILLKNHCRKNSRNQSQRNKSSIRKNKDLKTTKTLYYSKSISFFPMTKIQLVFFSSSNSNHNNYNNTSLYLPTSQPMVYIIFLPLVLNTFLYIILTNYLLYQLDLEMTVTSAEGYDTPQKGCPW